MKNSTKATIVRVTLGVCILLSIGMMYYVYIVQKDYVVFTNPGGPDLEETY